jgi:membrane-bound lytic murein transglycosylase D
MPINSQNLHSIWQVLRAFLLLPLFYLFISVAANATVSGNGITVHEFPVPKIVERQVWFWEGVFARYGEQQYLIHDQQYPDLIIDLIDFEAMRKKQGRSAPFTRAERDTLVQKYLERYKIALERFSDRGPEAVKMGAMEKRIHSVYVRDAVAYKRLLAGKTALRSQSGLADEFKRAAQIANKYLPYMERSFMKRGLPRDLTRVAFVESMFNVQATSKVGAGGIWQFMPGTAKRFMHVNNVVDERRNPLAATEGAAQYLEMNYARLKSWPLAITSYNHGAGSVSRAVRTVGSNNIGEIIERYDGPTFGFASKNFYAEFLAARNTYNRLYKHGKSEDSNPLRISMVRLNRPASVHAILRATGLPESRLRELNPSISNKAFAATSVKLPEGFRIIVPSEHERAIKVSINKSSGKLPKGRA